MNTQNAQKTRGLTPYRPGQTGNPGGRPKGLARYVRELVGHDGRRIADYMLRVLEDEGERTETRMEAARWLADRGFGRAHVAVEDAAGVGVLDLAGDPEARARARLVLLARLGEIVEGEVVGGEAPGEVVGGEGGEARGRERELVSEEADDLVIAVEVRERLLRGEEGSVSLEEAMRAHGVSPSDLPYAPSRPPLRALTGSEDQQETA